MSAKRCYYVVLGVERTASDKQISESYRKLAIKYHPDKNPGDEDAVRMFKEAAEAFEVLSDPEKRSRYDRLGHAGVDGPGGGQPHFHDINDIFSAFGDIFGDSAFGDLFGGGRRGGRARRGADVQCEVQLDLLEAARGVTKTIHFRRHESCDECHGSGARPGTKAETCRYCKGAGQVVQSSGIFRMQTPCPACRGSGKQIKDPCPSCHGDGVVARRVSTEVAIPAGVDDGTRLRLTGQGESSLSGGPAGDCYCLLRVKEHPLFQRDGLHLICQIPITYTQAALGATIEVPTLEGREELVIPPGTQPGDLFRLRGRGMPHVQRRGTGDLVVQVHLEVPKTLTERQEQLLRELAELEQTHVSPHRKSFFEKLKEYFLPNENASPSE